MEPILSACLVACHCGDEIDLALRCIQNADLAVSVFLSDNTPEEMTADRLKWAFPGLRVLPQRRNAGPSRAHNAVLPYLTSRYHLLMDPSTAFDPSLLRRMVVYMEAHPNIAILSPRFYYAEGEEVFFPRRRLTVRHLLGSSLGDLGGMFRRWKQEYVFSGKTTDMPLPVECAPLTFMMIRTDVFRTLQGLDPGFPKFQADADLCRRVLDGRFGSIVFHPDMAVSYHPPAENIIFPNRTHHFSSVLRYFMKWGITW
ncbi:MAG: glycosyltransferase [Clostridia bacterium]|nr:glycosyltransferase [Clostridia bacterium]